MNNIRWGRTIGPHAPHWPDTMPVVPHAAHAASELDLDDEDRDERQRKGHVIVTALANASLAGVLIGLVWALFAIWGRV